jgi:hypothetical protein
LIEAPPSPSGDTDAAVSAAAKQTHETADPPAEGTGKRTRREPADRTFFTAAELRTVSVLAG